MFTEEEKLKIEKKLGKLNCPICNATEMFFTEVPTHVVSYPSTENGIDASKFSYMNALCVHCLNCGYIMQFRVDTLLK